MDEKLREILQLVKNGGYADAVNYYPHPTMEVEDAITEIKGLFPSPNRHAEGRVKMGIEEYLCKNCFDKGFIYGEFEPDDYGGYTRTHTCPNCKGKPWANLIAQKDAEIAELTEKYTSLVDARNQVNKEIAELVSLAEKFTLPDGSYMKRIKGE